MTLIGWKYQRLPSSLKTKVRASSPSIALTAQIATMVMTIALQELLSLGILFENSIMPHLTHFFFLFFFMCKSPSTICKHFSCCRKYKVSQVRQQEEEEARPLTVALELPLHPPLKKESHPSAVPTIRHFPEESISEGGKIQD